MSETTLEQPLTTTELAAFLKTPKRTLEDWRTRKPNYYGPRFWYAGKRVLYSPEDVHEWMNRPGFSAASMRGAALG